MEYEWAKLKEPFSEVEWRIGQAGFTKNGDVWAMVLAYVTNRDVMDRLDDVFGPGNWQDDYIINDNHFICKLSVKVGDEWITKIDGCEGSKTEAFKGGLSGALKRAAVKFGIGRYLYKLESAFAEVSMSPQRGWNKAFVKKDNKQAVYWWRPPQLPDWALPKK